MKDFTEWNKQLSPGCKMRPDATNEVTGYPKAMHIVYRHVDPETRETVYIGEGKIQRAFEICGRKFGHHLWLIEKLEKFHIQDLVVIEGGNMTKSEARQLEKILIHKYEREGADLFNKIRYHVKKSDIEESPNAGSEGIPIGYDGRCSEESSSED